MKLSLPFLLFLPATSAWGLDLFRRSPSGLFVTPRSMLLDTVFPDQMIRRQQELMERAFSIPTWSRVSPRYEIRDTETELQISLDVPGVKADDIQVNLEEDGTVLSITGQREKKSETGSYSSKFSQSFYLDSAVDIDKFSANLNNGVLVIKAPKDMKRLEQKVRRIPIMGAASDDVKAEEGPVEVNVETSSESKE